MLNVEGTGIVLVCTGRLSFMLFWSCMSCRVVIFIRRIRWMRL